jgi:DNA-binding NarL/FixJ family response regulator
MNRIPTYVYGSDPVVEEGVAAQLRRAATVEVLGEELLDRATVAVVAIDRPDDESLRVVRALHRGEGPAVVLVVGECDEHGVLEAVTAGICGLLRRSEATTDVLGRLLGQVARLHGGGAGGATLPPGPDERELSVLRLLADGLDTRQIADELAYSERTIKGVIQELTRRLGVRNRSHAVAYAVRQGLI